MYSKQGNSLVQWILQVTGIKKERRHKPKFKWLLALWYFLFVNITLSVCSSPVLRASWASSGDGVHPLGQGLPELYSLSMWWSWAGFRAANSALREVQDAWTNRKMTKKTQAYANILHEHKMRDCKTDPLMFLFWERATKNFVVVVRMTGEKPICLFPYKENSLCYSLICIQSILYQLYDLVKSLSPSPLGPDVVTKPLGKIFQFESKAGEHRSFSFKPWSCVYSAHHIKADGCISLSVC